VYLVSWFVHASNDNVISVEETDKIVEALKKEEPTDVRYTRYDNCDGASASGKCGVGDSVCNDRIGANVVLLYRLDGWP
jgi:predicted peptidase